MSLYAHLIRRWQFWVLTAIFLFLITILILFSVQTISCTALIWENLPPLPDGETARDFTDVLVRNRINVLTDQGHYFSCRYEKTETCWKSIPREVNVPTSNTKGLPNVYTPADARGVVITQQYSNHGEVDYLVAVIRDNGQVSVCTGRTASLSDFLIYAIYGCCGMLLLIVGVGFFALVHSIKAAPQENPSNPSQSSNPQSPISNP